MRRLFSTLCPLLLLGGVLIASPAAAGEADRVAIGHEVTVKTGMSPEDFKAELGEAELIGGVEVESQWPAGYGKMTIIQFPK